MTQPHILVTNDDGIDCGYLHALATTLAEKFQVSVVAPSSEQSWAGRSFSRRGHVGVVHRRDLPWPAWAVDGTPSDAVNLALGSLLDKSVDMVVSGINVGFNVTLPLVMTSGTVAAALEGALWGCRAMACSLAVDRTLFQQVKDSNGHVDGPAGQARDVAAQRAAGIAAQIMEETPVPGIVHNVNFPIAVDTDTAVEATQLALIQLGSLFGPDGDAGYRFTFPVERHRVFCPDDADVNCLGRGHISHTVLDYRSLGRTAPAPS